MADLCLKVWYTGSMNTKRLSKSIRKFVRSEKARMRRTVSDPAEKAKTIAELYRKFH